MTGKKKRRDMAQETNQSQERLCTTGCGFYGNPRNNGMCSMCYKDFLQRQNNNGRVSPAVSSSTISSLGGSLLAQCSESSTASMPAVISHTDEPSGPTSVVQPAVHSEEHGTSETKVAVKTDDLPGICCTTAATAKGSGQEDVSQSSAAGSSGTCYASQSRKPGRSPSLGECSNNGKRKLEDEALPVSEVKASEDSGSVSVESQDKPKTKAKKSRCLTCRKKVGLTGFDCRCGNMFCAVHRYSDIHNCTYDYKAEAAEKIRKENPVIVGEKIQKL